MPASRVRVAFDARMLTTAKVGIGNYIVGLVNAFARGDDYGIDMDVYVQEGGAAAHFAEGGGVRIRRVPRMDNWRRVIHQLLAFKNRFGRNYDVLHFPDYLIPLYPLDSRVIVTLPDASIFRKPQHQSYRKYIPKRVLYPYAAARSETIITYSNASRGELEAFLPGPVCEGKIRVVPLAAPKQFLDRTLVSEDRLSAVRRKYSLDLPFVLFVGTVEPRKNLVGLLEAFRRILSRVPHELVIVGPKGWRCRGIFSLAKSEHLRDRVRFLEYVPDLELPALYRLASFLAYPSFHEGFGLPITEAFAVGTPVLTSKGSSMGEIAGPAALLVDPENSDDLANGLLTLCTDGAMRKRLSVLGTGRVDDFSWERCARETAAIYRGE